MTEGLKTDIIINRDALFALRELPDESVNCCVTSPPYYALRDYGLDAQIGREDTPEEYIERLVAVFHELKRVLRSDGTFWLNIADTYCGTGHKGYYADPKNPKGRNGQQTAKNARVPGCKQKDLIGIPWLLAFALRADGWYLRSDIIWQKENPMPESCKDRPSRCYEHKNKRDSNGVLTGRPGTVYDVNIKYTAPNGEKKTYSKKGFPTKKEATQHEAEMKAKLHNPGQIASIASQRKQTVASYLNEWVESYARVNLRPSTYDGYKRTIANYITPYIGGVALNQLTPAMVDKMFQQIIDKGLKPSTAAGAKRVLSVALSHARKYRYIETNAAKDTLTKFGKSDKTPDPYTPEQVKALMQRVEGTVWEMPVILGGLYGMRRSEILGLRWRNVDLENNTFDVSEQLPFKVPPKTKVIEEMAPPKSNGRKLPITELARPFFLKQFAMQEAQREQAEKDGKPYYDNDLVVAKPDGSPISASWVSSQFGKLLEDLDMPHIRFHDLRHTAATNMHQLTGDFYTVGEVLGHTLAGIGVSLGLSMNFEAVTARYVDVRLERKKEVLDAYHGAVKQADPAKAEKAEPKKAKSAAKKKSSDLEL